MSAAQLFRRPQGRWVICSTCSGDGSHSRDLGVVDPHDFGPDEWDEYLDGGYDSPCATCRGTGKVREDDQEALEAHAERLQFEAGVNEAGEPMFFDAHGQG